MQTINPCLVALRARIRCAILLLLATVAYTSPAATLIVTSTADSGAGSLRAALAAAASGDTIDATGVSGVILLASGELVVSNNMTILGPGPAGLALNGNAVGRVFYVAPFNFVQISGFTITNGLADGPSSTNGAGIYLDTRATLTVTNCILSGNSASNDGGGIYNNFGSLTLYNCTLSSNSVTIDGGGIYNNFGSLTVSNCLLSGNSTSQEWEGGGIYNNSAYGEDVYGSTLFLEDSRLIGNTAGAGGAIANVGAESGETFAEISSCTFSNNTGGAIWNLGGYGNAEIMIANSTISQNTGDVYQQAGVGIYNEGNYGNATLIMTNVVVSNNPGGGIFNDSMLSVANSTISGNTLVSAIVNQGIPGPATTTIANSTICSNSAGNVASPYSAAGIDNNGEEGNATLAIVNSTVSGNYVPSSGYASGIYNDGTQGGNATLKIGSTIVAGDLGMSIINYGTVVSEGYNLSSDSGGGVLTNATDQINTDPKLGPLQNNGGPTLTCALLLGSPAIDQGTNFNHSAVDQRGQPRTYDNPGIPNAIGGDGTDIGAFEFIPPSLTIAPNGPNSMQVLWPNTASYNIKTNNNLNSPNWIEYGGTVTTANGTNSINITPSMRNLFFLLSSP